jgi:hypothetical protein
MAQLKKKNIARLGLQGIGILGIFFGFALFCCSIAVILTIQRDNLVIDAFDYVWLVLSGSLLLVGANLIYTSYLMFRRRAFGAIKSISAFLAMISFGLVLPLVKVLTTTTDSEETARFIEDIFYFASLLFLVLVYLICVKLLKRLLKVAYSPKNISGTQHSTDKQ